MQGDRFDVDAARAAERPQEPRTEPDDPVPMRTSELRERDDHHGEEPIDEPGYGHGV